MKMRNVTHVRGPGERGGILCTGYGESTVAPLPRRLEKQARERGLAVAAVGAQVAQVERGQHTIGVVRVRVRRAIERTHAGRAVPARDEVERRASCEREIEREPGDQLRREIGALSRREIGEGDRRIDVVERAPPRSEVLHPPAYGDALGYVGADHDEIGVAHGGSMSVEELFQGGGEAGRGLPRSTADRVR